MTRASNRFYQVIISILITTICMSSSFAQSGVAKAIILRGKVVSTKDGKSTIIKKGSWVKEGSVITTAPKSFVKLLFIDKSSMNLGPKSKMKINAFPRTKPGIITLMKGQLRSKVTKNYLDMKKKNKSKLFIKTKSAAMGVRGTDFQVNYNEENNMTSLITFHGAVAMASLTDDAIGASQEALENIVSGDTAVIVKEGQFSGANPNNERVTTPVKISPAQLGVIKTNETLSEKQAPEVSVKQFNNIVPPGVSSQSLANTAHVESTLKTSIGASAVNQINVEVKIEQKNLDIKDAPPPEGSYNAATGELAPKAGGYIDLKTAQYIPPPKGSTFDKITQTYTPTASTGGVNPSTGEYVNPNYTLGADGKFKAKPVGSRSPASDGSGGGKKSKDSKAKSNSSPPPPPAVLADSPSDFMPDVIEPDNEPLIDPEKELDRIELVTTDEADDIAATQNETETTVNFTITTN